MKRNLRKEDFHRSLKYLIDIGVQERAIAGAVFVSRSTVSKWLANEDSMPRHEWIIEKIIQEGEAHLRLNKFLELIHAKMDELTQEHSLQGCLDFLEARGESYADIIEVPSDDSVLKPKVWRWHKRKNQARKQKMAAYVEERFIPLLRRSYEGKIDDKAIDDLRDTLLEDAKHSSIKVSSELESDIKARVARETGLNYKIFYSLYPIFDRYLRHMLSPDLISSWESARPEYEARKARSEV